MSRVRLILVKIMAPPPIDSATGNRGMSGKQNNPPGRKWIILSRKLFAMRPADIFPSKIRGFMLPLKNAHNPFA